MDFSLWVHNKSITISVIEIMKKPLDLKNISMNVRIVVTKRLGFLVLNQSSPTDFRLRPVSRGG
jgi:hypothetical protein